MALFISKIYIQECLPLLRSLLHKAPILGQTSILPKDWPEEKSAERTYSNLQHQEWCLYNPTQAALREDVSIFSIFI